MSQPPTEHNRESPLRAPRWVKVFGLIALVMLIALALSIAFGGSHGPGRHTYQSEPNRYISTVGHNMQQL